MSVGAKHWALSQTVAGGSSPRIVLFFLADWVIGDDQTECWPTVDTLSFETGMNRQTIMKATASLEKQGLIEKRVEWNGLRKRVFYRLCGFDPKVWVNAPRPKNPSARTSEISDVRNLGGSESRTSEISYHGGTKSRTTDSPKSRTTDGTKSRTGTGNNREIQGTTGTSLPPLASGDLVLSPDSEQPKAKPKRTKTTTERPDDVDPQVWDEFLILRTQKKKTFTDLALQGMRREAKAAGLSLEAAMTMCVENGWTGFKEKYVRESGTYSSTRPPQRSFNRPLSREQMALDDDF